MEALKTNSNQIYHTDKTGDTEKADVKGTSFLKQQLDNHWGKISLTLVAFAGLTVLSQTSLLRLGLGAAPMTGAGTLAMQYLTLDAVLKGVLGAIAGRTTLVGIGKGISKFMGSGAHVAREFLQAIAKQQIPVVPPQPTMTPQNLVNANSDKPQETIESSIKQQTDEKSLLPNTNEQNDRVEIEQSKPTGESLVNQVDERWTEEFLDYELGLDYENMTPEEIKKLEGQLNEWELELKSEQFQSTSQQGLVEEFAAQAQPIDPQVKQWGLEFEAKEKVSSPGNLERAFLKEHPKPAPVMSPSDMQQMNKEWHVSQSQGSRQVNGWISEFRKMPIAGQDKLAEQWSKEFMQNQSSGLPTLAKVAIAGTLIVGGLVVGNKIRKAITTPAEEKETEEYSSSVYQQFPLKKIP